MEDRTWWWHLACLWFCVTTFFPKQKAFILLCFGTLCPLPLPCDLPLARMPCPSYLLLSAWLAHIEGGEDDRKARKRQARRGKAWEGWGGTGWWPCVSPLSFSALCPKCLLYPNLLPGSMAAITQTSLISSLLSSIGMSGMHTTQKNSYSYTHCTCPLLLCTSRLLEPLSCYLLSASSTSPIPSLSFSLNFLPALPHTHLYLPAA